MTDSSTSRSGRRGRVVASWLAAAGLLCGCGSLLPKATPAPKVYALDSRAIEHPAAPPPASAPSLLVDAPAAAVGFDSRHIVYVREPFRLEHFAHSEWVETPAGVLSPLIVSALQRTAMFRAVGPASSGAAGDLRLETEVLRLQQEFGDGPSQVRFTLRAT